MSASKPMSGSIEALVSSSNQLQWVRYANGRLLELLGLRLCSNASFTVSCSKYSGIL